MIKKITILTVCALTLLGASDSQAGNVTVSGQVRYRSEMDKRMLVFGAKRWDWQDTLKMGFASWLRTRVNFAAEINENAHAFVQLQDSRLLGGRTHTGAFGQSAGATGLVDGQNVDIHQAYITIDNLFGEGWGGMAGRFELNLGNERLFGAVGWHNVGRSMEGAKLWYDNEKVNVTVFDVIANENQTPFGNSDYNIMGLNVDLKKSGVQLWTAYELIAAEVAASNETSPVETMKRISFGGFLKRTFGDNDVTANAVMQTGKQVLTRPVVGAINTDISAMMVAVEFGHSFPGPKNARVAVGVDFTSGDDGTDSSSQKAFNNMYYTGHAFRGFMDYFLASGAGAPAGLMDIMVRGKVDIAPGWTFKGDFHYFKTAQDYATFDGTGPIMSSKVGLEFDFTLATTRVAGVSIVNGLSIFLPQEDWVNTPGFATLISSADPSFWGYTQATVNF